MIRVKPLEETVLSPVTIHEPQYCQTLKESLAGTVLAFAWPQIMHGLILIGDEARPCS